MLRNEETGRLGSRPVAADVYQIVTKRTSERK